jgi:fumarate hydratase class II
MTARTELWGAETRKAIENFPVSGERVPVAVVRWLGRIKAAAARVNASSAARRGPCRAHRARRRRGRRREFDDQFPIDVFQTGSGTSSNMNANEVIARIAGDDVHPNDHVNMGQSSNDVFPSAVHLAALDRGRDDLLPALAQRSRLARRQGRGVRRRRQVRAHPHDGRRAGDAGPGVRRLRHADPARHRRIEDALPRVGRSRSAARRPAPA